MEMLLRALARSSPSALPLNRLSVRIALLVAEAEVEVLGVVVVMTCWLSEGKASASRERSRVAVVVAEIGVALFDVTFGVAGGGWADSSACSSSTEDTAGGNGTDEWGCERVCRIVGLRVWALAPWRVVNVPERVEIERKSKGKR